MNDQLRGNHLLRDFLTINEVGKPAHVSSIGLHTHKNRIRSELRKAGVTPWGLLLSESRYLPQVIHPDEHIGGVVYGRHEAGTVMLIATDRRVIFLDKKPLFINEDDLTYDVVSGVSFGHAGIGSTVALHTRIKDYTIRTLNSRAAERFVQFIELRCLEHTLNGAIIK